MTDPQTLLRALYRRLEARAFRELKVSLDETLARVDRDVARARSIACKTVAEEVLLVLTEPTPEERT